MKTKDQYGRELKRDFAPHRRQNTEDLHRVVEKGKEMTQEELDNRKD